MKNYLIEDIFEKYMEYRKDSEEVQKIDRRSFERFINNPMDRSYASDERAKYAQSYLALLDPYLKDPEKLVQLCNTNPEFVKSYIKNCFAGLQFKDTFKYPIEFRKLMISVLSGNHGLYSLFLQNKEDFEKLYEDMWKRITYTESRGNELTPAQKKIEVLDAIFASQDIINQIEFKHVVNMPFKEILAMYLDTFNISKDQVQLNDYHLYKNLGRGLYHHLKQFYSDKDDILNEWNALSDDDKTFISSIALKYKNIDSCGHGLDSKDQIEFYKQFKSFDILEAITFKLSSSSAWWDDKSVLANAYAVWYGCIKNRMPKYVQNKCGKFKALISLYGYDWNKLKSLILKDPEIIQILK